MRGASDQVSWTPAVAADNVVLLDAAGAVIGEAPRQRWRWVRWDDLARAVRLTPFAFSPWAVRQIVLLDAIGGHAE